MEAARSAAPHDLARLARLLSQAVAETATKRGGPQLLDSCSAPGGAFAPSPEQLSAWLGRPDRAMWVGTIEDETVGMAAAVLDEAGGPARVAVVYVEPEARGVGVGECLLGAVIDWARSAGSSGLDATALPGDRQAKQFFEAHGLVARLLTMHRSL